MTDHQLATLIRRSDPTDVCECEDLCDDICDTWYIHNHFQLYMGKGRPFTPERWEDAITHSNTLAEYCAALDMMAVELTLILSLKD